MQHWSSRRRPGSIRYDDQGPRADGTSEVVISDYLGSARVTLSTNAEPLQSSSYHPYGTERTSTGSGARTSYIGREHDNESDLGFFGVRLYEPEYGRFLSTDVLWGKYLPLQPYQYAGNEPVGNYDNNGKEIVPINLTEKERELLSKFVAALRRVDDSYLRCVLDYAQSASTRLNLYSMPDDVVNDQKTFSMFGGDRPLEDEWFSPVVDGRRLGMTLQSESMASAGLADIMLSKESVLSGKNPFSIIAFIDELHHVYSPGIGIDMDGPDHIQLFTHLLQLSEKGAINLPKFILDDLREYINEAQNRESTPTRPEDEQRTTEEGP